MKQAREVRRISWIGGLGFAAMLFGPVDAVFAQDSDAGNPRHESGPMSSHASHWDATKDAWLSGSNQNGFFYWKDGLRFGNDEVQGKLGGRIQTDFAFIGGDENLERFINPSYTTTHTPLLQDGTRFRRVRYETEAVIREQLEYRLALEFSSGETFFRDAYLGFRDLGALNLRIGQFREPVSLEVLSTGNALTFMERSLAGILSPVRSTGVMAHGQFGKHTGTWAVGVFRGDDDQQGRDVDETDSLAFTARLTWLPWYEETENQSNFLHVGGAFSWRNGQTGNTVTYSSTSVSSIAPTILSTGAIPTEDWTLWNVEAAWVCGPLVVHGEFVNASLDTSAGGLSDPSFHGHFIQASYFLTDDQVVYDHAGAVFGRPKPNNPAFDEGGVGAWEVALRYSALDLSEAITSALAGKTSEMTAGVNWWIDANFLIRFEVVFLDVDPLSPAFASGSTEIFQMRTQVNF